MRKLVTGVLILAMFAAGTIFMATHFEHEVSALVADVEEVSALLSEGESAEAINALEMSIDRWREMEHFTYIFINHTKIDAVSDAYYDYLSAVESSGDDDEGQREKLIYHLSDAASMEKLSFGTIF